MRILVTGAAGYLGSHLIRALEGEHEVTGVDLFPTSRVGDCVADLTEEGAAAGLTEGVEVVVHTAAIHPWKPYTDNQYMDNNIKPVHHVLKAAVEKGVRRVVYTSSIAATGYNVGLAELPLRENAAARPDDLYGATKWFGEVFCQRFARHTGLETVCMRPPAFFPMPELQRGLWLLGIYANVSDVVGAHVAAVVAEMPTRYEAFWCTGPVPYAVGEAQELRENPAAVVERHWPGVPEWFAARGMQVPAIPIIYDLARAKAILGWEPTYSFDVWWKEHAHEL